MGLGFQPQVPNMAPMTGPMRLLWLKSWRDLRRRWISFLMCSSMVAIATMLFVAFSAASSNLDSSCRYTYEQLAFLDFTCRLKPAPPEVADAVARISGVEGVEGRQVHDLRIRLRSGTFVSGRTISVPCDRELKVNRLHLEQGRMLAERRGEVLMEKRFAQVHGYRLGDRVEVETGEVILAFTLVGLVSSPEYIWLVTGPSDPRPAARRFGVLYLTPADLSRLTGLEAITEVCVRVSQPQQREAVLQKTRQRLAGYLAEDPIPRERQPSHALFLRDRRAFAAIATLFPTIFMVLSGVILVSTLTQLIAQQRRQIGILMTQGFSDGQILSHYLGTSLLAGAGGALVGCAAGYLLGLACTRYYVDALGIPFVQTHVPWLWMLLAFGAATALAAAVGWKALWGRIQQDPAEILRSEFSTSLRTGRRGLPVLRQLPYLLRLPLKNLMRQPARTTVMVFGIALAVAQMNLTLMMLDSQRSTLNFFFRSVHCYDMQVDLKLTSPDSLPPIASWPGVSRVESVLWWLMKIRRGNTELEWPVMGVGENSELLRLYDRQGLPVLLSRQSPLYLGMIQKQRLKARTGDPVETRSSWAMEVLRWKTYPVGVDLFEPIALPAKVSLSQLQAQISQAEAVSSDVVNMLYLKVSPQAQSEVRRRLYLCPAVVSVTDLSDTRADVREMLKMLNAYLVLMILCSGVLAVALVAGCSTMNMLERLRELATLSILGISDRTLVDLLLLEAGLAWLLGLALGLPLGLWIGNALLNNYQSELIHMQLEVRPLTLMSTALSTLAVCMAATLSSIRQLLRAPLTTAAFQAD